MLRGTFSSRFEKKLVKYRAEQAAVLVPAVPKPVSELQPCWCGECEACQKQRAQVLRVVAKGTGNGAGHKRSTFSATDDAILSAVYANGSEGNAFKRAQQRLNSHTPAELFRRAAELGLIRIRERYRWSDNELSVVEAFAHCALETIQRKLVGISPKGCKRTRAAIAGQIHSMQFRSNLDGLNHTELAKALGVSPYLIHQWREQGLITGTRLPSIDQHHKDNRKEDASPWFYHNVDTFVFLLTHGRMYDLRRVNQQWYVDTMIYGMQNVEARNKVKHA